MVWIGFGFTTLNWKPLNNNNNSNNNNNNNNNNNTDTDTDNDNDNDNNNGLFNRSTQVALTLFKIETNYVIFNWNNKSDVWKYGVIPEKRFLRIWNYSKIN